MAAGLPVLRLRRPLAPPAAVDAADWPAGVAPRRFDPDRDLAAAWALLAHVYADGAWGDVAPFAAWRDGLLADPEYDAGLVFLAAADEALVGVALCWTSGFLKDLGVAAGWRRRGLGRAMLRSACRALGDRGAPHVDLKVRAGNPAIALYLSEGFRPVPEPA